MRLIFRPVVAKDLPAGFDCIGDGFLFDQSSKQAVISMWADLLSRRIGFGSCIEDLDKTFGRAIVGFSVGAFARPEFAREIREGLHPYVSVRILEKWRKFRAPLLSEVEIARANASCGAHLLTIHSGIASDIQCSAEGAAIADQREAFFHYCAVGFRLKSVLLEVYGDAERLCSRGMRLRERPCASNSLAAHAILPRPEHLPCVVGIDAAEAAQMRGTTLASLFTYFAPLLGLCALEQEMLQFALAGNTDQELAELLCVSYPTIRKRWDSIYTKATLRVPQIFEQESPGADTGRGGEKRRRVLGYVHTHRQELRPYPR